MSDSARDWLIRGIVAAKSNDPEEARFLLERVLHSEPSRRQLVDAYFWLSEISREASEKRNFLEQVLIYEPTHYAARRNLAILDGRLDPDQVVEQNQSPLPPLPGADSVDAQRFACPQCGGRLTYTPDGSSLTCQYCERRQSIGLRSEEGGRVAEEDFILALATAKGRRQPTTMSCFVCQSCGASFVLSPEMLSLTCPYCASVYVLEHTNSLELIPPEGIIPFKIPQLEAERALRRWLKEHGLDSLISTPGLRGLYLPAWTFDISGQVPWTGLRHDGEAWRPYSGSKVILKNDLLVPAGRDFPETFIEELDQYRLDELIPFDPRYLVDWPAETYGLSVSEAAMQARWKSLENLEMELKGSLSWKVKDLRLNPANLLIEAYRLVLLPVWITSYEVDGREYTIVVSGQTGDVRGQAPPRRFRGILGILKGDR